MSRVSAIIPVWNSRELLATLLGHLRRQTHPIAEVIVVDNGSTDGCAELAAERGARVIPMGRNRGFAYAVNRGIEACRTEYLAILNADVEPARDWLAFLMRAAAEHGVWFATGKILQAGDRRRIDGTWDALCRGACAWRIGSGRMDGPSFSRRREICFAPLTAAVFRADLFRRTGLLDEMFESYLEDIELGLRCACLDCRGLYVPEALAWHAGSTALGTWSPEIVRLMARNQMLLVARHYSRAALIRCGWSILAAQGLWGLVALRHGSFLPFLRGKISGLQLFRRARVHEKFPAGKLISILSASEREIHDIQRATGFDLYWRLYFALTSTGSN